MKTEHLKKESNKKKHIEQQTKKKCSIATTFEVRLVKKGQARKSTRGMPWHQEPMKDVISCEKLRGSANNY